MNRAALALLLCLAAGGSVRAQELFGGLTGTAFDETRAALPGAKVVISNKATTRTITVLTDGQGVYRAEDLEPGRYVVRFELAGFTRTELPDVPVVLGKLLRIDATLKIGSVTESLQVAVAPAPAIDIAQSTVAHNITADEFDRLPRSRSFLSLASTSPSVNTGTIEGGMQVNGASGAENTFTVDGVMTSSLYNGRSRQDAAFEYLQEIQVKTAGIQAEYGGAMGGVISAVSRSGGNTLRGEAHYFYEGSRLAAAPVKRLVLNPVDDKTVAFVQDGKPTDDRHEPGGSLGGPLVKDRLFLFLSASPRLTRRSASYQFSDGQSAAIAQRQHQTQAFAKISYAGRRVTGYASALATPVDSTGTLPAYNSLIPNGISSSLAANSANVARGFDTSQTSATGRADITLSGASFLTLRASYFRDTYGDTGIPVTTSFTYQTSSVGFMAIPASLQGPIGTQNTPRALITSFDTTSRLDAGIAYTHTFHAAGQHTVKAGASLQRAVSDARAAYPGGYVLLYWDRTFSFGGRSGRGAYGYYEVNDRGFTGTAGADTTASFVQDDWTIGTRLTVALGLRVETEKIPTYRPDLRKYILDFGPADKLAPRLGASYDVSGNGRLKVYGSWGRYYDWTKYQFSRNALGADFWKTYYRALDTLDLASLNLGHMPGTDLWVVPGSPRDQAVPSFDRIDAGARPTFQDDISLGVESQAGTHGVLTVHYVHNDLKRVLEDVGTLVNGNRVLYITNPGEGAGSTMAATGRTAPFATPRVKRIYDALEIGFARRLSGGWFGSANYTFSRLDGNYAGLANSDEIRTPTTGGSYLTPQAQDRSIANPGGALRTSWNIDEVVWDSHGNLDVRGRLATDRPHVLKLYGAYAWPFGTQVGMSFYAGSGTPMSTYVNTTNQTEVFVNGRGDMGRTPALTQANLLIAHTVPLARTKLRLELDVLNVFNRKTAVHVFNYLNRGGGAVPRASSAINLTQIDLARGYDYDALIRATPDGANAYDPRYGKADLFADGARAQFLVKLLF